MLKIAFNYQHLTLIADPKVITEEVVTEIPKKYDYIINVFYAKIRRQVNIKKLFE